MKVTAIQELFKKNVTPVYLGSNSLHSKDMCGTFFPQKNAFPQFSQFHCTCISGHIYYAQRGLKKMKGCQRKMTPALIHDVCFLFKLKMQIQKTICLEVTVKEGSKKCSFDVFFPICNLVPN